LHFIEQPDVLDGDHGLVSKGLHQLNLPILERANVEPKKADDAECLTFARKRDAEGCLEAYELLCLRPFVVRISKQIGYVYDVTFGYCSPEYRASVRLCRISPEMFDPFGRAAESRRKPELAAFLVTNSSDVGFA
jgi:hypothetical protein